MTNVSIVKQASIPSQAIKNDVSTTEILAIESSGKLLTKVRVTSIDSASHNTPINGIPTAIVTVTVGMKPLEAPIYRAGE